MAWVRLSNLFFCLTAFVALCLVHALGKNTQQLPHVIVGSPVRTNLENLQSVVDVGANTVRLYVQWRYVQPKLKDVETNISVEYVRGTVSLSRTSFIIVSQSSLTLIGLFGLIFVFFLAEHPEEVDKWSQRQDVSWTGGFFQCAQNG
jgi:hypothetical protein